MRVLRCISLILVMTAAASLLPAAARADSAQQAFVAGKALMAKADFDGALRSFATAARADRDNRAYLQQYAIVRRIIALRGELDAQQDASRWEYIARGLHAFYVNQGIYTEALTLDREIHARLDSASSGVMLAETQLALNLNAEAAEVLSALDTAKQTATTQALHALAIARQGKIEQAGRIAKRVSLAEDAEPGVSYYLARLHAAIGNGDEAIDLLTRCFESVAPSRLERFKVHVRQSPDFAELASTSAFAKVLQTESKVSESGCSGGSRCAGCPMRGKCGKDAAK